MAPCNLCTPDVKVVRLIVRLLHSRIVPEARIGHVKKLKLNSNPRDGPVNIGKTSTAAVDPSI